mmetsp:Transcript_20425/g.30458  ORF Transcript_20425/g.30458 Transcript_20425/m.30458 type:complete len:94 (-) Transcript_20425:46-327(-)
MTDDCENVTVTKGSQDTHTYPESTASVHRVVCVSSDHLYAVDLIVVTMVGKSWFVEEVGSFRSALFRFCEYRGSPLWARRGLLLCATAGMSSS